MTYEECTEDTTGNTRMESLLQVQSVAKSFCDNHVLKDFTLDIKDIHGKPQIVALLGQSGAGKTTALRIISGLDKPDSGEVLVSNGERGEQCVMHQVEAGKVGVVFQKYPLFEHLNIFKNLVEPAVKTGTPRKTAEEKATAHLQSFEMLNAAYRYPVELSGGMRQRIAILQQLMVENRHFIVLDEPFSGLDVKNVQLVIKLLNSIAMAHTLNTFIIVTHDITNALIIADTVYVLGRENGQGAARIMKTYDLIDEGLAYHHNIEDIPRFNELRKELKYDVIPKL
jgi:NitT/TauT family transport system ATP-binding protein